jgi:hypothetical protein
VRKPKTHIFPFGLFAVFVFFFFDFSRLSISLPIPFVLGQTFFLLQEYYLIPSVLFYFFSFTELVTLSSVTCINFKH